LTSVKSLFFKIGLDGIGWNTFRHSYRSLLDETYAPIGVQQRLMRHAQVSTTMNIYGNAAMKSKREANPKIVQMILEKDRPNSQTESAAWAHILIVGFCGVTAVGITF
jgi:hypothetical protein